MTVFRFSLPTIMCSACTPAIEAAIKEYQEFVISGDTSKFKSLAHLKKIRIKQFDVDYVTKLLTVTVDDEKCHYSELQQVLNVVLDEVGHQCDAFAKSLPTRQSSAQENTPQKILRSHGFQGGVGIVAGVGLLCLPFVPIAIPWAVMIAIAVVSVVLTLVLGAEFYFRAKKQLETREPAMDLLFALSTLAAIGVSIAAFFIPGLPMMFEAGLLIFGFRHVGLAIRDSVAHSMRTRKSHQSQLPKKIFKLDEQSRHVETNLTDIKPGDLIVVLPGDLIPTDGLCVLLAEQSEVKPVTDNVRLLATSNIDGATFPRQMRHDDRLLSGMRLLPNEKSMLMKVTGKPGYRLKLTYQAPTLQSLASDEIALYLHQNKVCFCVKNTDLPIRHFTLQDTQLTDSNGINHAEAIRKTLSDPTRQQQLSSEHYEHIFSLTVKQGFAPVKIDSYLKRLDQGIEDAERTKPTVVKETEAILRYFVPTVLLLALLSGGIIGCFFPLAVAINCALSVLVAACPCTLGLITPLAIKIGIQKASARGVRINQAQALEDLARIEHVIFDLHGTLTTGKLSVDWPRCKIFDETLSEQEFMTYLTLLEQEQNTKHPIGQAIYHYSSSRTKLTAEQLASVADVDKSHHAGLAATIDGQKYLVGSPSLLQAHGVDITNISYKEPLKAGDNVVFLARGRQVLGYLIVNDPLRPDAVETVKLLKASGKVVHICTGADQATALRYAKELQIDAKYVYADCAGVNPIPTGGALNAHQKKDKKTYIDKILGRKLMIVDAANDSVAMKSCTSIAMKHPGGDETTQQQAGAVIENGSLRSVLTALEIGKYTMRNIKQNLWLSLLYNIGSECVASGLLLTVGITLSPGIYVALMIVQMGLILLNAGRFQQQELSQLKPLSQPTSLPQRASSYRHVMRNTSTVRPKSEQRSSRAPEVTSHGPLFTTSKHEMPVFGKVPKVPLTPYLGML